MIIAKIFKLENPDEPIQFYKSEDWSEIANWLKYQIPQIEPKQEQSEYQVDGVYRVTIEGAAASNAVLEAKVAKVVETETEPPDITAMNAETAIVSIKQITDQETLELLLEEEHTNKNRSTVLNAINEQLEAI